jgi:hypothetical protein
MNLCDRIGLRVAELSRNTLMNNVTPTAHLLRQRAVYHRERATAHQTPHKTQNIIIAELLDREAGDLRAGALRASRALWRRAAGVVTRSFPW